MSGPKAGRVSDSVQDVTVSTSEISFALDLTIARINQLARKGIVRKEKRGRFWILRSLRNYLQFARSGKIPPESTSNTKAKSANLKKAEAPVDDLDGLSPNERARYRKTLADAEKTELELLQAAGILVSAESVSDAWEDMLGRIRAKMLSIPKKVAPIVQDEEDLAIIERQISAAVDEALSECASYELPEESVVDLPREYITTAAPTDG